MSGRTDRLGQAVSVSRIFVKPSAMGSEIVALYSLPGFDRGNGPDLVLPDAIKSSKLRLDHPCVLVSKLNPHIRRVWRVEHVDGPLRVSSTEFVPLVPGPDIDLDYLYYLCLSPTIQRELTSSKNGTSESHQRVQPERVLDVVIDLPLIDEQRAIAAVLDAIEAKAESNRRLSRQIVGFLTAEYRSLATSRRRVEQVFTLRRGVSYSGAMLAESGVPMLNLANFGIDGSLKRDGFKFLNETPGIDRQAKPGDLLIANTDMTQERRIVGRGLLLPRVLGAETLCFSHHVYKAQPLDDAPDGASILGFLAMRQPRYVERMRTCATGTTVVAVTTRDILAFDLDWLSDADTPGFVSSARQSLEMVWALEIETEALTRIRDALLSDLIEGNRHVRAAA